MCNRSLAIKQYACMLNELHVDSRPDRMTCLLCMTQSNHT